MKSYATGPEEADVAPVNAINEFAAPPAVHTRQWDTGLRYTFSAALKLVAGVFDVRKPYYSDDANVFRLLGQERHTALELSLTGRVAPGLTIVVGSVLLDPRVTGEEVASGRIGPKAVGQSDCYTSASVQYQLPRFPQLSIDTRVNSSGWRTASADNRLRIPPDPDGYRRALSVRDRWRAADTTAERLEHLQQLRLGDRHVRRYPAQPSAASEPNAERGLLTVTAADAGRYRALAGFWKQRLRLGEYSRRASMGVLRSSRAPADLGNPAKLAGPSAIAHDFSFRLEGCRTNLLLLARLREPTRGACG